MGKVTDCEKAAFAELDTMKKMHKDPKLKEAFIALGMARDATLGAICKAEKRYEKMVGSYLPIGSAFAHVRMVFLEACIADNNELLRQYEAAKKRNKREKIKLLEYKPAVQMVPVAAPREPATVKRAKAA
jgi:hypothetical protein